MTQAGYGVLMALMEPARIPELAQSINTAQGQSIADQPRDRERRLPECGTHQN